MRIAYVDPTPVPGNTPAALQILQTVDAIAGQNVAIDVITPASPSASEHILGRPLAGCAALRHLANLQRRWFFPFASNKPFYWQALFALKNRHYDALLVRNLKLADRLLSSRLAPPLYFETHEIFAQSYRETVAPQLDKYHQLQDIERRVYSKARGIFAITSLLSADIRSHYGVDTPCWVVPDGVDMTLATQALANSRKHERVRLLYFGSLHPWKGVEFLIEAMRLIERADLVIAGGSPQRIAELQQLARRFAVADRVQFAGWIEPVKRFEFIADFDICMLPLSVTSIGSRYTSPLKLFEYMAMGKPVVAPALPSVHEVLPPQHFGAFQARPEDPADLARVVNLLIARPELRHAYGRKLRELSQHFSWSQRAGRMVEVMRSGCTALNA